METNELLTIPYDEASKNIQQNPLFTLYEQFLKKYKEERNPSERTIIALKQIIPRFLNFYYSRDGGDINNVKPEDVVAYLNSLPIRTSSRKTHRTYMVLFFNYLFKLKLIEFKLPTVQYKGPSDIPRTMQKSITRAEYEKLVSNAHKFTDREWIIFYLISSRPFRMGELTKLKVGDINWETKDIYIHRSKNKDSRIVPLPTNPENFIRKFREFIRGKEDDDLVFGIKERQMNMIIKEFCEKVEVKMKGRNSHAFRHFAILRMDREKISLATIAKMAGNTPTTIEEHYLSSVSYEDIKQAALMMDKNIQL